MERPKLSLDDRDPSPGVPVAYWDTSQLHERRLSAQVPYDVMDGLCVHLARGIENSVPISEMESVVELLFWALELRGWRIVCPMPEEEYPQEEVERRAAVTLRRMLATPPAAKKPARKHAAAMPKRAPRKAKKGHIDVG